MDMDIADNSDKKSRLVKQNSVELLSPENVIEKQIFEGTQTKVVEKIPEKKQCCLIF